VIDEPRTNGAVRDGRHELCENCTRRGSNPQPSVPKCCVKSTQLRLCVWLSRAGIVHSWRRTASEADASLTNTCKTVAVDPRVRGKV
jgi:hypothetical protein